MAKASYFDMVYDVVRCVPHGRVTTYGTIASFLSLGSARMVGWALNNCHDMGDVPAHRVVNRKGELSGRAHFRPPSRMQELLELEGIKVENDAIVGFEALLWNPADHF
ncbi:MAG: MGMT family protein [Saprospiraceae bacterium]|nr:MGMT family protein [Saprospiraceae bacterium]